MDKGRATSFLTDLLEFNIKIVGIAFRICHDLGPIQCDNVVGDDLYRLVLKIGIIDAKVTIEPSDLASNELARDEALDKNHVNIVYDDIKYPCLLFDFLFNQDTLLILACKDGRDIACMIFCMVQRSIRRCAAGQGRGRTKEG